MTAAPGITEYAVDAERALLGILMDSPQLADRCGVMPGDLAPAPGHPEILAAVMSVYDEKRTADPVLVSAELMRRGQLATVGTDDRRGAVYLAECMEAGRATGTLPYYARIVRESKVRRLLHSFGQRLVQTATQQPDLDVALDNAAEVSAHLGTVVDTPIDGDAPIAGLSLVADFVREPSPEHAWVIPGMVERGDRVMLIAGEGGGKSVLARQLCVLLAAGRHPFMPGQAIRPRRTLLIDLENPPDLLRRGLRGIVTRAWTAGHDVGDRAWKWTRPGGIDLRSAGDRALLAQVIEKTRPDLVAIGPLYKAWLGRAGDSYEQAAGETAAAVDAIRERYGCAFWIEHHAPKGDGASRRSDPIGSSLWLRWPEFGLTLKRDMDDTTGAAYTVDRFRGDRDVRAWPDRLIRQGVVEPGHPWRAEFTDEDRSALFDAIDEDRADAPAPTPAAPIDPRPQPPAAVHLTDHPTIPVAGELEDRLPATREQLTRLAIAFGSADRHERLTECARYTGRPELASMTELTRDEASHLIDHLEHPPPVDVADPDAATPDGRTDR